MPGGCNIGSRKIDMHIRGLERLGVEVTLGHGFIHASAPEGGLVGAPVTLEFPSVGATENLLMAAVLARGTTVIENAAREPEIVDLAEFLVAMGAEITGAGSPTIEIEGVERLAPAEHRVVGDRIEAGTFLVAGALGGGPVTVRGFDPHHLKLVIAKLREAGCEFEIEPDAVTVSWRAGRVRSTSRRCRIRASRPTCRRSSWRSSPPPTAARSSPRTYSRTASCSPTNSSAWALDIRIEGHHGLVRGVERLSGAPVRSTDLRGGAALVLAGLAAEGRTVVGDVHHIDRGYERFVEKLSSLGADVTRAEANPDGPPEC